MSESGFQDQSSQPQITTTNEQAAGQPPERSLLKVSVIIPARNERDSLPKLIESIENQTRRPEEVIVADGMSTDGTREWLIDACQNRSWLKMIDNPELIISSALNAAIATAQHPIVARMDAHATYSDNYLEKIIEVFEAQPEVVGAGAMMVTAGKGPWGHAIASVLSRPFGLGGARHRVNGIGGPVDHTFSPAYRKDAVLNVGGFDTSFLANEDFELDRRLQNAGGQIWLEPSASCTWYVREDPRALAKQMWRYGFFKARTLRIHPKSLKTRQLAPPFVLIGLTILTAINRRLGKFATAAYLIASGGLGARAAIQDGSSPVKAAVATPTIHASWGAGLIAGMFAHFKAKSKAS